MFTVYLMLADGRTIEVSDSSEESALKSATNYIAEHRLDVDQWTMQDKDGGYWYPLYSYDPGELRLW